MKFKKEIKKILKDFDKTIKLKRKLFNPIFYNYYKEFTEKNTSIKANGIWTGEKRYIKINEIIFTKKRWKWRKQNERNL